MNNKVYPGNYLNYQLSQCSKQIQQTDGQTLYPYPNISLNNAYTSTTNYMDIYNVSPQNASRGQQNSNCLSINAYQEQMDFLSWENRLLPDVDKGAKVSDKMEMIEITSKDLSPASYCSNIDLLVSDCYKSNASCHNKYENQWYNQSNFSQKNVDYPSCAQEKSSRYWSMQKNLDIDSIIKSYALNSDVLLDGNDVVYKNNRNVSNDVLSDYNMYNYYDNRFTENQHVQNENYFNATSNIPFEPVINPIDQQTEGSNEESDIIVEESDEEITDYSEDQEKRLTYQANKCLICNVMYTPLGTQFYFLTFENPLTMSSQKPVYNKIVDIIGKLSSIKNYLCSECLGLINTIDHLQLKLESFHKELIVKFKKTCTVNGTKYEEKSCNNKIKPSYSRKFPKYKCKLCRKVLCAKKYCNFHLKKHKSRGYLCELCGRISPNKRKFFIHLKKHKKKTVFKIEPFTCSNCDKIFRTRSNLREHENYCLGTLPFTCGNQHCDKKFPSATKLRNHVKLKHDKKFVAICSICNIGFVKVSDYKSHKVSHSTEKKFSCLKCDKSYKTLSNLNFHMKIHNNKLPFNCDICKKGYMRKEYLEAHVNNHKGIKNFGCTMCDKKFALQKNLDAHMKYHDGTIKKNKCNICGKSFSTGFEEHLRVHNNLREFECDHCDMKFNTKSSLSKHTKKKHSDVTLLKSSIT